MRVRSLTQLAGGAIVVVGAVVLGGWMFHFPVLESIFPGLATMKANTALGFAMLGAGLWLAGRASAPRAVVALGATTLLLGALSLTQDLTGWHAGIDQLLFRDPATLPPLPAGRPSPATSLMFVLLGAALSSLGAAPALAQALAAPAALLALLSLLGYLFGATGLYRVWIFSSVALHTAICFALAAAGTLAARPGRGWIAELMRDMPGALMGRRLVGAVLIVLPLLAWLRLKGQQWGWYGVEVGLGIMVVASVTVLFAAILWSVRRANVAEERILQLSRLYAVLSRVNQQLVRNRDLDLLMAEVCRIAVEVGGFAAAWIALSDAGSLTLRAHHGAPRQDAQDTGRAALAAGAPVMRAGSAAFPIRVASAAIGVFGFQARDGAAFDAEERRLLEEISGDVALALEQRELEAQRDAAQAEQSRHAERLRTMHAIDRAILEQRSPAAIAQAALRPLRDLLEVPRVVVNLIDLETGEAEWLAAIGRQRAHVGPGVRYPVSLMGDLAALRRGEPQAIDTEALAPSEHRDALLASGVRHYMAAPMIAGGELIGALSFGGEAAEFPPDKVGIAIEAAAQMAIAISQARLHEQVRRQASELEQRVEQRTAQLAAANKELESFSYSVSHDLRAPLRAIEGYAHMLEEDHAAALDAEGRRLLSVIRDGGRRMNQLIEDLLSFSRLGRQAMRAGPVDMAALAREVLDELRPPPQVRVSIGALPGASADRALMRQVWVNLLSNAIKYSAKRDRPAIDVEGTVEGEELVYRVTDNGAGFDMKYAHRLFGVFQRLHREDEFPGTGVGLATVQRVVTRHGGRVWSEAAVDAGATFFFSLPARPTP